MGNGIAIFISTQKHKTRDISYVMPYDIVVWHVSDITQAQLYLWLRRQNVKVYSSILNSIDYKNQQCCRVSSGLQFANLVLLEEVFIFPEKVSISSKILKVRFSRLFKLTADFSQIYHLVDVVEDPPDFHLFISRNSKIFNLIFLDSQNHFRYLNANCRFSYIFGFL